MEQFEQKLMWKMCQDLLHEGKITEDQQDDIIEVLKESWRMGYEEGSEESEKDFENDREHIWHQGYTEGLEEGQCNV